MAGPTRLRRDWILFVSVPPVGAVLTYANNYIPGLIGPHTGLMTGAGTRQNSSQLLESAPAPASA